MPAEAGLFDAGVRRAALLMSLLGPHEVGSLATSLNPAQAAALEAARQAVAGVPAAQRKEMLAELRRSLQGRPTPHSPESSSPAPPLPAILRSPASRPAAGVGEDTDRLPCIAPEGGLFGFVAEAGPAELAAALADEPPLIIAQIATHAPEGAAQRLLAAVPAQQRQEALLVLPHLARPAPGVLRCLHQELQEKLIGAAKELARRRAGARAVAAVLVNCAPQMVQETLDALERTEEAAGGAVAEALAGLLDDPGGRTAAPVGSGDGPVSAGPPGGPTVLYPRLRDAASAPQTAAAWGA